MNRIATMRTEEVQKLRTGSMRMRLPSTRGILSYPLRLRCAAAAQREVAPTESGSELAEDWDTVSVPDGNSDKWDTIEDAYYSSGDEDTTEEQVETGDWLRLDYRGAPPEQSLLHEQSREREHESNLLSTSSGEETNTPETNKLETNEQETKKLETKKPEHEEHLPTSPSEEIKKKGREESESPKAVRNKRDPPAVRMRPPRRYRQWSSPRSYMPAAGAGSRPVPPSALAVGVAAVAAHQCKTEKKYETSTKEEDSPEDDTPHVAQVELEEQHGRLEWYAH